MKKETKGAEKKSQGRRCKNADVGGGALGEEL